MRRADQEYQAPPFYRGELGYNPGFDGDDPEKAGLDGEDGLPGELRFVRKYKRQRKINILGTLVCYLHKKGNPPACGHMCKRDQHFLSQNGRDLRLYGSAHSRCSPAVSRRTRKRG